MKQKRPGKEIVKLLKAGLPPRSIMKQTDTKSASIRYWAKRLGLPLFKRGRPLRNGGARNRNFKTKERALAKELRANGKAFSEIGRILNITRQRAHQYFLTADA